MDRDRLGELLDLLTDPARRVRCVEFPGPLRGLEKPGLYSWWVDGPGAAEITAGLGETLTEGLLYAGQTGAGMSKASLAQRVGRNHRRGNVRGSTFRRTLAAVLHSPLRLEWSDNQRVTFESERRLSEWMDAHLSVAVCPFEDRKLLSLAEAELLVRLNPPLNLDGMSPTPLRERLSALRTQLGGRGHGKAREDRIPVSAVVRPNGDETSNALPVGNARIDALSHLAGLIGRTIYTLSGKPNRILALNSDFATVATGKSPDGEDVPVAWVQTALDKLVRQRELEIDVRTVDYRSAFIGAVLANVPGVVTALRPRRVSLKKDPGDV